MQILLWVAPGWPAELRLTWPQRYRGLSLTRCIPTVWHLAMLEDFLWAIPEDRFMCGTWHWDTEIWLPRTTSELCIRNSMEIRSMPLLFTLSIWINWLYTLVTIAFACSNTNPLVAPKSSKDSLAQGVRICLVSVPVALMVNSLLVAVKMANPAYGTQVLNKVTTLDSTNASFLIWFQIVPGILDTICLLLLVSDRISLF